ncbi:hypothetical protein NQZ68_029711 [Dissostichus eleginoides]|nr:hypothetical protein NQZ68_029711 [Dissostichus eleginoides]
MEPERQRGAGFIFGGYNSSVTEMLKRLNWEEVSERQLSARLSIRSQSLTHGLEPERNPQQPGVQPIAFSRLPTPESTTPQRLKETAYVLCEGTRTMKTRKEPERRRQGRNQNDEDKEGTRTTKTRKEPERRRQGRNQNDEDKEGTRTMKTSKEPERRRQGRNQNDEDKEGTTTTKTRKEPQRRRQGRNQNDEEEQGL